jgi:protein-S-isoprenylcysteine O-methyltransferase Ste14
MKPMANEKLTKSGIKVLIGTFLGPFIQGTLIFVSAGRIDIFRVWCYLVVSCIGMFGGIALVARADPELVNQRGIWKKTKGTKLWDKFLLSAYGLIGFYVLPVIAGLDVGRFRWSSLSWAFLAPAGALFLIASILIHWAMIVNTHFETTIRIQTDRNHQVITKGPYRFIRHPGYLGAILWALLTPLIIGSAYALIPAAIAALLLIIRTLLEDKTLRNELTGYSDYANTVKYRLLPGLW